MKAISLWQPWASAVALGLKRYETRSWPTRYRGPLLIHAATRWTPEQERIRSELAVQLRDRLHDRPPLGCILAVVNLVDCYATCLMTPTDLERFLGDFSPGRFAWDMEPVVRLAEPIPCRGMQGLWNPSYEVVMQLPRDVLDRIGGVPSA